MQLTRLIVAVGAFAGLAALSRSSRRPPKKAREERDPPPARSIVDEAGMESFPASDPPGWTLGPDLDDR